MEHNFTPIEFAQLLASRICHDLISPISSVNNGFELLNEEDNVDEESRNYAMNIIEDSAKLSAIKLKIMRAAFGANHTFPNECCVRDIAQLVDELAEKNKVTLLWQNADGKIFNPHQARNMLHIILIALESLPRGGCISIGCDEMISFTITGEKVIFTEEKIAYLNKSQQIPAEPRLIGFILLHMMKANIQCDRGKDCLIIKLC